MATHPVQGAEQGELEVHTPAVAGRYDLVAIAASAGGIEAIGTVLNALPSDFPVPIAIVQHRTANPPNLLARVLARRTTLAVKTAEQNEVMRPGTVYLAPPDLHLTVRSDRSASLINGGKIRHVLSSANPLFSSAAEALGGRVIAVVLTGGNRDATDGVQSVRMGGGVVLAQDEATSEHFAMPRSAIATGCVDRVLPLGDIAPTLIGLVTGRDAAGRAEYSAAS
jgi:two-component system, chemotaxis family, protein-glutamate methylesterase/glutaminase